jgi:hypothetical protein
MPPVSHDARAIHGCLSMRSRDRISVGQEYEVMIEVNDGSETATVFRSTRCLVSAFHKIWINGYKATLVTESPAD